MTNIKFEPFGARIVVLPDGVAEKKGDIHIPESAKKEVVTGTVVATGPMLGLALLEACSKPLNMEDAQCIKDRTPDVGDRVRFLAHTGNEVVVDGVAYLVLEENCVLGRFT
jgi:co-chaperonin GroES (HSP10)